MTVIDPYNLNVYNFKPTNFSVLRMRHVLQTLKLPRLLLSYVYY